MVGVIDSAGAPRIVLGATTVREWHTAVSIAPVHTYLPTYVRTCASITIPPSPSRSRRRWRSHVTDLPSIRALYEGLSTPATCRRVWVANPKGLPGRTLFLITAISFYEPTRPSKRSSDSRVPILYIDKYPVRSTYAIFLGRSNAVKVKVAKGKKRSRAVTTPL